MKILDGENLQLFIDNDVSNHKLLNLSRFNQNQRNKGILLGDEFLNHYAYNIECKDLRECLSRCNIQIRKRDNMSPEEEEQYFILRAFKCISKAFQVTQDMLDTFSNSSQNIMVFLSCDIFDEKLQPKNFKIIGALMYHFNPCLGSFISIIKVNEGFERKKWGSNMLRLYQYLIIQATNMKRLLIWYQKGENASKLISFYRSNGFHVTIPTFHNIQHVLPQYIVNQFNNLDIDTFLLQQDKIIWTIKKQIIENKFTTSFNFKKIGSTDSEGNVKLETKKVWKPKVTYFNNKTNDLKCMCCLSPCGMGKREFYSFCVHKVKSNNITMMIKNSAAARGSSIEPYHVCGTFMCSVCQQYFGHTSTNYCPLHMNEHVTYNNPHDYIKKQSIAELDYFEKILTPKSQNDRFKGLNKLFFNGSFEYNGFEYVKKNIKNETDISWAVGEYFLACKYCRFLSSGKELLGVKYSSTLYDDNCIHAASICNNKSSVRSYMKLKEWDNIGSKKCDCDYSIEHPLFFDGNIGSMSSLLQNQFYGIKPIPAKGDCFFYCIYIAILSKGTQYYASYRDCIVEYIEKMNQFCEGLFEMKTKTRNSKKGKNNKNGICLLRDAFFLACFDKYCKDNVSEKVIESGKFDNFMFETNVQSFFGLGCEDGGAQEASTHILNISSYLNIKINDVRGDDQVEDSTDYHTEAKNSFNELRNMYGKDTSSVTNEDVIWFDAVFLNYSMSRIFNKLGVLTLKESENGFSESCFSDNGFYSVEGKHFFKEHEEFILIRHQEKHFELFYDIEGKKAIHKVKQMNNEQRSATDVISHYIDDGTYWSLFGERKKQTQEKIVSLTESFLSKNEIEKISNPDKITSSCLQDIVREKSFNTNEFLKSPLGLEALNLTRWLKAAIELQKEARNGTFSKFSDVMKAFGQKSIQNSKEMFFFPIVVNPRCFNINEHTMNLCCFILVHYKPSSDHPDFFLLDCNKLPVFKIHGKKSKPLEEFFNYCNDTLVNIGLLYDKQIWRLPTDDDINHFLRHVVSLLLEKHIMKRGKLHHTFLFDLGIENNPDIFDNNIPLMIECLGILFEKIPLREEKKKYFQLLVLLDSVIANKGNPEHTSHSLLNHFKVFNVQFGPGWSSEYGVFDEIFHYHYENYFKSSPFDVIQKSIDKENKKFDSTGMVSSYNVLTDIWNFIWSPLGVFDKETDHHYLKYVSLLHSLLNNISGTNSNHTTMLSEKFKNGDSDQSTIFRIIWFLRQEKFKTLLQDNNDTWFSQIKTISEKDEKTRKELVWTKSEFEYELNSLRSAFDYFMGFQTEPKTFLEKKWSNVNQK